MENQVENQEYKEYKEQQSSIVSDMYLVRRNIERLMPDCRERDRAIMRLDEATFWLKEIPVHII